MLTPDVTVVIPLFNKREYVQRAVNSALAQSFQRFEVLVVDDGSTDGSAQAVRELADPRLRLVSQENHGVSAARNRGIVEARGEYVAFLDADDEYTPRFLDILWELKERFPDGKFFAGGYQMIYCDGSRHTREYGLPETCVLGLMSYLDCCVRSGSPVMSSAVMVKKDLLQKVGMFPVGQKRGEDLDTWVRLLMEAPLIYHSRPIATCWDLLPLSACATSAEVYLEGNRVLTMLDKMSGEAGCEQTDRESIFNYLAWYMSSPIDRLIAAGKGAEARKFIASALRSKRFRLRYLVKYLKSWLGLRRPRHNLAHH